LHAASERDRQSVDFDEDETVFSHSHTATAHRAGKDICLGIYRKRFGAGWAVTLKEGFPESKGFIEDCQYQSQGQEPAQYGNEAQENGTDGAEDYPVQSVIEFPQRLRFTFLNAVDLSIRGLSHLSKKGESIDARNLRQTAIT